MEPLVLRWAERCGDSCEHPEALGLDGSFPSLPLCNHGISQLDWPLWERRVQPTHQAVKVRQDVQMLQCVETRKTEERKLAAIQIVRSFSNPSHVWVEEPNKPRPWVFTDQLVWKLGEMTFSTYHHGVLPSLPRKDGGKTYKALGFRDLKPQQTERFRKLGVLRELESVCLLSFFPHILGSWITWNDRIEVWGWKYCLSLMLDHQQDWV